MSNSTGDRATHISPFEVMCFLDGEMSADDNVAFQQHLLVCPACSTLYAETREQIAQLSNVMATGHGTEEQKRTARQRLEERLTQQPSLRSTNLRWRAAMQKCLPYAAAAAAIFIFAVVYHSRELGHRIVEAPAALLPDGLLTPGAVRSVSLSEICAASDDDDLDPKVTVSLQKAVFHEYGISVEGQQRYFQVDYLINPQLGGVNDVRNLWPQPYTSEWNAEAKDALERHLHRMVCERKIELAEAQHEIASNWIDAYKKYFHTSKPI